MPAPIAIKKDQKYNLFNTVINDEYHWLRDKNWPEVTDKNIISYLEEENSLAENFFQKNQELKENLYQELKSRIKLSDQSTYTKKENYYYYSRTEEDKEYPIYCRKNGLINSDEEILLDINLLATNHKFTKLCAFSVSPKQDLLAYSVDFDGNEEYEIYIKDIKTNNLLKETIPKTIGSIIWHEDQSGFFYTPTNEQWRHDKIMFHKLHTEAANDKLITHEKDVLNQLSVQKSSSKKYIFIESGGHDSNEIYYFSMEDKSYSPIKLISRKEKIFYNIDHGRNYFYIHTNDTGPNFRILRLNDKTSSEEFLEEYIPHSKERYISSFDLTKNYLILNYKVKALPDIRVIKLEKKKENKITFLDNTYTASAYSTNYEEDDIRINYSSLKRPDCVYQYNFEQEALTLLKQVEIPSGFNPDEYETEQKWVTSENIEVPISIFYKKSLFKKDGTNTLYLYGYGSYGYAVAPNFRNTAVTLADRGFVFVIAHIRGGDDLGYEWYESAKFLNKKRTFEDFARSAEYLIENQYTYKGGITIAGGSAGGLLIGYSINNYPDLFKAAIAHVPFVDVVNTMLDESLPLTPGEFKEWGNPKEKEYFDYMLSYSPYDNISKQNYPSMYVTAGLSDPRVGYWEAAKWVAKLRANKTDDNIILLNTNMSAGHAGASGRFDYLKEVAEDYTFIFAIYDLA